MRCLPFIELTLNQVGSQHMGYACIIAKIRGFCERTGLVHCECEVRNLTLCGLKGKGVGS